LADIAAYFQEIFSNIRVLKTFVAEKIEYEILNKKMKDVKKANFIYGVFKKVEDPLIGIINSLTNVAILFFIASQLINGTLTTTGFFMYLYVGRSILGPLNNLSLIYLGAQKVVSAEEKLREVFSQRPSVLPGETPISELKKGIRFEDVSFRYGHEEILSNISFDLEKGEMLALVGPSGSGKSTITDLLLRFYDPESGVIRVDGIDLRELNLEDYRRLYGSVAQESELFNSTVSENIAYAKQGLSESEIIQAAKIANAHDFIEQLPGKYETNIGDRGVMLSGGQRQRLAIARAVVRNPQLLIMDEATSSLDSVSEQQVQIAIDRVIVGTTAVVVAHRISTVKNADKILVLDKGRVIDMGKHEELYRRCEIYKKLCDLQFN
jgi:subfamily B ATP-binding cassette protein MsbA